MKQFNKMIKVSIMLCIMLISFTVYGQSSKIVLNGQNITGIQILNQEGSILIPLRAISTYLGAQVQWSASDQSITITRGNVVNKLKINDKVAYKSVNGVETTIPLTSAPILYQGSTFVPLRYVAESLDTQVAWDAANYTAVLQEKLFYLNQALVLDSSVSTVEEQLGKPNLVMSNGAEQLYIYNSDYENLLMLFIRNNKLNGFCTSAKSFSFRGITYQTTASITSSENIKYIQDEHNQDRLVALSYKDEASSNIAAALRMTERMIFELTNGFRKHNQVGALTYNDKLTEAARMHSQDMADNNYFSHTNLKGEGADKRITRIGLNWISCGENIAAGHRSAILTYGQWVNSWGHRVNMLEQTGSLGVGSVYKSDSSYKHYHTQNFASVR